MAEGPHPLHAWTLDPVEAARIQNSLRARLKLAWDGRAVRTVGGADVSIQGEQARAAIVVLRYPELTPLEGVTATAPLVFPYMAGLLAFREGPAVLAAWERLQQKPDLLMFGGQGIAHPRGLGIAAHMGLWLELPTIGVAKSWLYGRYTEPAETAGSWSELTDPRRGGQVIGSVVRSKERVKPLFVSPGNHIDVAHAIEFVLGCVRGYRLPETMRWAHRVAGGEKLPNPENDLFTGLEW